MLKTDYVLTEHMYNTDISRYKNKKNANASLKNGSLSWKKAHQSHKLLVPSENVYRSMLLVNFLILTGSLRRVTNKVNAIPSKQVLSSTFCGPSLSLALVLVAATVLVAPLEPFFCFFFFFLAFETGVVFVDWLLFPALRLAVSSPSLTYMPADVPSSIGTASVTSEEVLSFLVLIS